jgi:glycine oxidase
MARNPSSPDVIVIGAGIIGLAVAWRARQRGFEVTVLERGKAGQGASRVAAGMLAPVSELEFGDGGRRLLAMGLRSAELWPAFAAELEQLTGMRLGLRRTGTLFVARDQDEARELERQVAFRSSLGLRARRLLPSEARAQEPALAPAIRLAMDVPDDHSIDPRSSMAALLTACHALGVDVREQTPVAGFELQRGRVCSVALADGGRLSAGQVVVATGAWTTALQGLPASAGVPVRPVKGQTLRLRDRAGPGLLGRAVRFEGGYLVPRGDGRYVLGGTVEERGFDESATAGGVYDLLREAHELVPGVSELEIEELCVGLRPGTPDNVAAIGHGAVPGLLWAVGHYRNGILLCGITAELVVAGLLGEEPSALALPFLPARFSDREARSRDRRDRSGNATVGV